MRIFKVANKYFDRCQYIKTLSLPIYDIRKYIYPRGEFSTSHVVLSIASCHAHRNFNSAQTQCNRLVYLQRRQVMIGHKLAVE